VTLNQTPLPSESQQKNRRTWLLISILVALIFSGSELAALWMGGNRQVWAVLPVIIAAPIAYWLNRTGRQVQGSITLLLGLNLQFILVLWVHDSLTLMNAVTSLVLAGGICIVTLPRQFFGRVLVSAMVTLIVAFFIDLFGGSSGAELNVGNWIFLFVMLTILAAFFAREFLSWDIRTKIVSGILGTGALAVAVLMFFVINQTQQVAEILSARLETSVRQKAEEQLVNTALLQANLANQAFQNVMDEVEGMARNWSALQGQKDVVSERTYWDAGTNLVQWPEGHYGNSANDTSSLFIPAGVWVNEMLVKDLNTSAYLDFYAPGVLEKDSSLLAVYAIDTRGVIRYYPNINLAKAFQETPDFDATTRPYYSITTPESNPERLPRWSPPYLDATGGGLVLTVAAPVYEGNQFAGIVAADMQLAGIVERLKQIPVGETGYAFLIDNAGNIRYLPDAGYKMFGIEPSEEFHSQTLLGLGNTDLQTVTKRMTEGGSGFLVVNVDGVDTYVSFSPIKANGYSIALVVPVSELQGAIIAARNETEQQIQSASQTAVLILILLFLLAIVVSLGLGQIIAAPIQRLTHVATQIAGGDLSVQATATTRDEIGTLAQSFNTMTARLRQTLDGLERMVEERTAELLSANERNERRAKQFESIAQVARTVSSARDLDVLLTQITTVISKEFGFYHVGIFLLDSGKEYAILSAANSEGGKVMLERGHRLKVGETGMVGYVTGTGKPRVALDTEADATFFNNPDLPETRSEMALPLGTGEEIIGALDVQSIEAGAFSQEDISILSTLADQVSVAIQNARQFEQTRKALNEAEALSKQFAQTGWQQYTKDKNLVGIHHTGARTTLLHSGNGKEKEEGVWDTDPSRNKSRGAFLSLPIELRGETIGSVDVRSPDNRPWDQDELDIVTAIIERSAIAMENARLLEESQRLASKEAKIGAVTAKISASINMRNVLQTAVEELGRALPGSEVVIQFQPEQNKNKPTL
jgi:GAF domain-containing protein/HAMP domain-containing protein